MKEPIEQHNIFDNMINDFDLESNETFVFVQTPEP